MTDHVIYKLETVGYTVLDSVLDPAESDDLREFLLRKEQSVREIKARKGLWPAAAWSCHHFLREHHVIDQFVFSDRVYDIASAYLGGPAVLNSVGCSIVPPGGANSQYTHGANFHRDIRTFVGNGNRMMLWFLIMLNDFSAANGATFFVPASHHASHRPPAGAFRDFAVQSSGRKGSVAVYDADVWHSSGPNTTDAFRVAVTVAFTRPLMKPQFDYLGLYDCDELIGMSDRQRQVLGYYSRVPTSLEEWYQPTPEQRLYRADQG